MQPEPVITIERFNFSYGTQQVFNDISLKVEEGTIHGILGPNGAGKSTLFNSVFYHHKFDAISTAKGYEKELALLQTEPYFYPYMTGMEYLKILCTSISLDEISLWNEIFQLPLEKYVHNYSTGMKKKIGLLGVVLLNKKIILLDEPTNGLDLESSEFFKILVRRLVQRGSTVLVSSHIIESLFAVSNRITLLANGSTQTFEQSDFERLENIVLASYTQQKQDILDKLLPGRL